MALFLRVHFFWPTLYMYLRQVRGSEHQTHEPYASVLSALPPSLFSFFFITKATREYNKTNSSILITKNQEFNDLH